MSFCRILFYETAYFCVSFPNYEMLLVDYSKNINFVPENKRMIMTNNTIIIADNQAITHLGLQRLISITLNDAKVLDAVTERELTSLLDENKDALVIVDPANFFVHFSDDNSETCEEI